MIVTDLLGNKVAIRPQIIENKLFSQTQGTFKISFVSSVLVSGFFRDISFKVFSLTAS